MPIKFSVLNDHQGVRGGRKRYKIAGALSIVIFVVIITIVVIHYEHRKTDSSESTLYRSEKRIASSKTKPKVENAPVTTQNYRQIGSTTIKSTATGLNTSTLPTVIPSRFVTWTTTPASETIGATQKVDSSTIKSTEEMDGTSTTRTTSATEKSFTEKINLTTAETPIHSNTKLELAFSEIDTSKPYILMSSERGTVMKKSSSADYFIFASYSPGKTDLHYNLTKIEDQANTFSIVSWEGLALSATLLYSHRAGIFQSFADTKSGSWIIEHNENRLFTIRSSKFPDSCLIDVFAANLNGHEEFSVLNDLRNCTRFPKEKLWVLIPVC